MWDVGDAAGRIEAGISDMLTMARRRRQEETYACGCDCRVNPPDQGKMDRGLLARHVKSIPASREEIDARVSALGDLQSSESRVTR